MGRRFNPPDDPGPHTYYVGRVRADPRYDLLRGEYNAQVVSVDWRSDYTKLGGVSVDRIVYALTECPGWRYIIHHFDRNVDQDFLDQAAREGGFTFTVGTP